MDEPPEVILPASVEPTPKPAATVAPTAFPTSAVRSHNYDEVEDRTYYYIAAVSEEDRKRGKAAGSVFGYRYIGRNADGEHVLALVTGSGAVSQYSRCPNKCVVINTSDGDRIAYTNASIVGAAFEDAIGGQLKRWVPPRAQDPVYYDPPQIAESPQPNPPSSPTTDGAPGEPPLAIDQKPAGE